MKKNINFFVTLIYAICLIVFGYVGFHKSGSAMSLFSGGTFGILLLVSCFGMYQKKKWGFYAAPILTAILTILFTVRALLTHKPVPITLACVSAVVLVFLSLRLSRASS